MVAIGDELADVVEAIAVVGRDEGGGVGLLAVAHLMVLEEAFKVLLAHRSEERRVGKEW